MIPLSPRLLCCASFVTGDFVCDIGTDHAYLPAYLVTSGKCRQAVATDVRTGPLECAKGTLKRWNADGKVRLIHTDGFADIPPAGITDVVIAGMGGETIRDILAADADGWVRRGTNLVLQPMSKAEILRSFLAENGFAVTREKVVKDVHVYTVMQAHYDGTVRQLSPAECYCGKLSKGELLTRIYLAGVQQRLTAKADGLASAGHTKEAEETRALICAITAWLNPEWEGSNDNSGNL